MELLIRAAGTSPRAMRLLSRAVRGIPRAMRLLGRAMMISHRAVGLEFSDRLKNAQEMSA